MKNRAHDSPSGHSRRRAGSPVQELRETVVEGTGTTAGNEGKLSSGALSKRIGKAVNPRRQKTQSDPTAEKPRSSNGDVENWTAEANRGDGGDVYEKKWGGTESLDYEGPLDTNVRQGLRSLIQKKKGLREKQN